MTPPVVKPMSTPIVVIVPVYPSSGSPGWLLKTQFKLFCEPRTRPMLDDIEQVSVPTWTCRGSAAAGPINIARAATVTDAAVSAPPQPSL